MDPRLVITNIGFIFSFVSCLGLGILVFVRRPKDKVSSNTVFFLMSITICVWIVSYALGINLYDPDHSRLAFMFNLSTLYLAVFSAHLILSITGRLERQKWVLKYLYIIATGLVVYFISFPDSFMLMSRKALYLPNFLVPGPLYGIQDLFFFGVTIYLFFHLIAGYYKADHLNRNRLKYFFIAFIYGYLMALVPEFLLYEIPIDPMPAAFMGLFTIPMAYVIIQYDLIEINIIAKRAFLYALGVTIVTLGIILINSINDWLGRTFPGFPEWLFPVLSSIVAVGTGVFVWKKIREVDILKYEFINVVTHKFRTPLTQIKWSAEMITATASEADRNTAVAIIKAADSDLVELTNSLVDLSNNGNNSYLYVFEKQDLGLITDEVVKRIREEGNLKHLDITSNIEKSLPFVLGDRTRLQFAVQTIIDNAVTYTPEGGTIDISLRQYGENLLLRVADSGIGIPKEEIPFVFSRFFRGVQAKHVDTTGLGIGLFISKEIIKRHKGDIWVESGEAEKGSVFFIRIPIKK